MGKNLDTVSRIPEFVSAIIEVAKGNFNIQIGISPQNDELDVLATSINMMIDKLKNNTGLNISNNQKSESDNRLAQTKNETKKSREELEEYKATLKKLIHKYTLQLEEKNKKIEHFNSLFIQREFRIKELRDRVKELEEIIEENQNI